MISFYRFVTNLIYGLVYLYGRFKAKRGDHLWTDRLALATYNTPVDLWVHAASVGEVRVVNCLVTHLFEENPGLKIHLTVMTRTGYQTARSLFGPEVDVSFLPLDVPRLMRRKLQSVRPKLLVIAETEIWPNLIIESARFGTPIVLVNGRMSDRALRQYRLVEGSFHILLGYYDKIFVKSDADRDRFRRLVDNTERLVVAGDMKFDAPLHKRSDEKRRSVRASLGVTPAQFLFVAGSTREGEEAQLFELYPSIVQKYPKFRLVVAPRHIERVDQVLELARNAGIPACRLGEIDPKAGGSGVVIVDRMGMLNDLYLAAELTFVGGTLVNIGGHNLLEPVWAGTPVLFGPSVSNVSDAAAYIQAHNFGGMVQSADELRLRILDALCGKCGFDIKTDSDTSHSATAISGSYLLEKLRGA